MSVFRLPWSVYRSLFRREGATTLHNQFVQIFAGLIWAGSIGVATLTGRPEAVPYGLLLLFLYIVPLFGVLTSVSAAHEEREERAFLWSQPVPRSAFVLSKAATLSLALVIVLLGALVPAASVGAGGETLTLLWGLGGALVVVSVSAGLAVGQYTRNRARGLMAGLVLWFAAFALYDAAALSLSGVEVIQNVPIFWVALLLFNPVDAVRLAGLFGLGNVPFSAPGETAWMSALVTGIPIWVAGITIFWTVLLLVLACRRIERQDL